MKVIFLDIDGVLNDHSIFENGYCGIKRECVDVLNKILNIVPEVKLVISSAWRYNVLMHDMTLKGFENLLLSHGVNCKNKVVGVTSSDETTPTRGRQIYRFLLESSCITKYVILDDSCHDFDDYVNPKLNYVLTDGGKGLQESQIDFIIKKLLNL